jgi:hypothetical protein
MQILFIETKRNFFIKKTKWREKPCKIIYRKKEEKKTTKMREI